MSIAPKNWKEFQHYKDRAPQWIKLHRKLLDDFEFASLPVASRALAPMLWLLASEYEDGVISASNEAVAFRLRISVMELETALKPLILSGFFVTDSDLLAERKHDASLEKEREKELEKEEEGGASAPTPAKPTKEKRSRRAAEIPLPPSEGIPAAYLEHAKSQGVMGAAAEREWRKFKDHAEQKDRRCAGERGWMAAWRGWITKAIEFRPQIVSKQAVVPATAVTDDDWRMRLQLLHRDGIWNDRLWGDPPSTGRCKAPAHVLAEFEAPERMHT